MLAKYSINMFFLPDMFQSVQHKTLNPDCNSILIKRVTEKGSAQTFQAEHIQFLVIVEH